MPEYVYALHEFTPENPDEVPLKVGERIEVVEKDDMYGDGWWQGRNSSGVVGLFPQSYTSSIPPPGFSSTLTPVESTRGSSASSTVEGPVKESTRPISTSSQLSRGNADPILSHSTEDVSNEDGRGGPDGEMMQATMTDVQKAIEQLGRGGADDGQRSFSFTSSRSQSTDHSETEDTDKDDDGDAYGWSKGTRTKLAQRAQQANEEREARDRVNNGTGTSTPIRSVMPPIDVEMSDESEDEIEERIVPSRSSRRSSSSPRSGSALKFVQIPEENEEDVPTATRASFTPVHSRSTTMDFQTPPPPVITVTEHAKSLRERKDSGASSVHIEPSEDFIVPSPGAGETELPTARAEKATFPPEVQAIPEPEPERHADPGFEQAPSPTLNVIEPSPLTENNAPLRSMSGTSLLENVASQPPSTTTSTVASPAPIYASPKPMSASISVTSMTQSATPNASTIRIAEGIPLPQSPAFSAGLPSPTASSFAGSTGMSSAGAGIQQTLTPATTMSVKSSGANEARSTDTRKRPVGHPSEWSVEQVVEWLRSKSFDDSVCNAFIEQEITGDVLLDLDANVLKSEIGIVAFGKRARIVNAIAELTRPPSIFESPSHTPARITTPRSQERHSLPYSHSHSASMQSSAHTQASSTWAYPPVIYPQNASAFGSSPAVASTSSPDGLPSGEPQRVGWPSTMSEPPLTPQSPMDPVKEKEVGQAVVGLGLGLPAAVQLNGDGNKHRPAQLLLSPSISEGAVLHTATTASPVPGDDERGTLSEGETTGTADTKTKSRRLFWRYESGSIKDKVSMDNASKRSVDISSPQTPPTATTTESTTVSTTETKSEGGGETSSVIPRRPSKKRESIDKKAPERLSFFGGTLGGTLKGSKSRKPPPRLSSALEKSEIEKHQSTFSRIRERRTSSRPSTADGTTKAKKGQIISLAEVEEKPSDVTAEPPKAKEESANVKEKVGETKEKEKTKKSRDVKSPARVPDALKLKESPGVLRKRTSSNVGVAPPKVFGEAPPLPSSEAPKFKPGQPILDQIGPIDYEGWMRKKSDRYNTWKVRYFVLTGPHLYCLRNKSGTETKIKGYINIVGYKVIADENIDPGRYGFKIVHDTDKTHYFSSEENTVIREWMKALMKATISRDYNEMVVSSCNIPTIPLAVAQAMNPAPRPPSPGARAATQRAMRPENPNQLSQRDAEVLLRGVQAKDKSIERARLESFFTNDTISTTGVEPPSPKTVAPTKVPPRPSRELRRLSSQPDSQSAVDSDLIDWANSHLPTPLQVQDITGPLYSGLALLRLAEDIKGKPSTPRVPDSAFPSGPDDDKLDGLFRLFDFLLDNDVKMGTVSINDIRQCKKDKIVQLLRAMRVWEDKRKTIAQSLGPGASPVLSSYNVAVNGGYGFGNRVA